MPKGKTRADLYQPRSRERQAAMGDAPFSYQISYRHLDGLYMVRYSLCDKAFGRTLRPLFDRIGSGEFTLLPESDPLITSAIESDKIASNAEKARAILGVATVGSFLAPVGNKIEDLDKVIGCATVYSKLAHAGTKMLARKFKLRGGLGISDTGSLLRAIGAGAITVIPRVDEELRMQYLSSSREVREYLAMSEDIADRQRRSVGSP